MPGAKTSDRPTLKTIAQLSGLAVPTVSRALNDAPDIGDATKARVRAIAADIGYRPDRAGLRLRTGKTNVIALILSTEDEMMNHTARLITAIAGSTRGTPYHMIVTPYFPDQDPMDPVRYVTETRSADGVILNQTKPADPRVAYLMEKSFPFATHGRTGISVKHPFYDFDNGRFGELSVRRLVERGRKTLGMVAPRRDQFYAMEMIDAATEEARKLGVSFRIFDEVCTDDSTSTIASALTRLLAKAPEFDGLITASTNSAMALVTAIEENGRHLGQDIDLIAKEALPFLQQFRKETMVIPEDVSKAGNFLGRAVMQAIDHPELPPMQHLEKPN